MSILDSTTLWLAQTNCYVLAKEAGGLAIVIDAPPAPDAIGDLLRRHDLTPVGLLITHGHIDHVGGAGTMATDYDLHAYLHPDDDFLAQAPEAQLRSLFGMVPPGEFAPPDFVALSDTQKVSLAGLDVVVEHTPGHSPGHCIFLVPDEGLMFSGDQLFAGGVGRWDLPGGDYEQLMVSMKDRVLMHDDALEVLPGHGPRTNLGVERRTNPFLQDLV